MAFLLVFLISISKFAYRQHTNDRWWEHASDNGLSLAHQPDPPAVIRFIAGAPA
jgi:hypothetical protein